MSAHAFQDLQVHPGIVQRLDARGIREPSEVQRLAIPHITRGADTLVQSETGSGKTFAYLLPLLSNRVCPKARAVIVVPTRELAVQTHAEIASLSGEHAHVLISGTDEDGQLARVRPPLRMPF
jgi:superfamily II DNA/RNA helicase